MPLVQLVLLLWLLQLGTGTAGTKLVWLLNRIATLFCCDEELEPDDVEPDDVDDVDEGGWRMLNWFRLSWSGGIRERLGPAIIVIRCGKLVIYDLRLINCIAPNQCVNAVFIRVCACM